MKEKTNRFYQFNGFQIDVDEGVLQKGDEAVPLTPKAFDALVFLLKNRGKVIDKEVFLNEIWADTYVAETTLAQNIFTIRKALGTLDNGEELIKTIPRRVHRRIVRR